MLSDVERARQAKTAHQQPTSGTDAEHQRERDWAIREHNTELIRELRIDYMRILDNVGRLPTQDAFRLLTILSEMSLLLETHIRLLNNEHSKRVHD